MEHKQGIYIPIQVDIKLRPIHPLLINRIEDRQEELGRYVGRRKVRNASRIEKLCVVINPLRRIH
jgi:hypothetical protein